MVTPADQRIAAKAGACEFLATFQSLQLATASATGEPLASYAPFVRLGGGELGILISELAAHTANLRANPQASIMLIEPEDQCAQIYARKRLVCQCAAQCHSAPSAQRDRVIEALQQRFGAMVEQLAQLPDFHAFTLRIQSANYVSGFAQAFKLSAEDFQ